MKKILLLEDDLSLINGLSFAFKKQGYELDNARTVKEAQAIWKTENYDMLVIDVTLPEGYDKIKSFGFAYQPMARPSARYLPIRRNTLDGERSSSTFLVILSVFLAICLDALTALYALS